MLYGTHYTHGGDVYGRQILLDYSINLNPLGTPDSVVEAIKTAASNVCCYPDPYCRNLTAAIASREGIAPDEILCSNGGAELIYAFCDALNPRKAVMAVPGFSEYEQAVIRNGCETAKYQTCESLGFVPDEGFVDFIRRQEPDLVFLCNPNNPDGRLIPKPLLKDIVRACAVMGCRVFLDECFLELSDGYRQSMVPEIRKYPGLFILKAFTKSYGMAGVRLGYGISSDQEMLGKTAQRLQPWNVSVPAQEAGVTALKEEDFLASARTLIRAERAFLSRELSEAGLKVMPSEANFMLIKVPGEEQLKADRTFAEKLLEDGILIRNCEETEGLGKGWYRICVRKRAENEMLVKSIRKIMRNEKREM